MAKYILKRLFYIVVVFFIMSIIIFFVFKAVPGDPAMMMLDGARKSMKPEAFHELYQRTRAQLGLDDPMHIQYFKWLTNMLRGNFGFSVQHKRPVIEIIGAPMWNTVYLNLIQLPLVFAVTIPLGIATAIRKGSKFDTGVQIGTIVGYSLPTFVIFLIFIYIFAIKLPIFPISGAHAAGMTAANTSAWVLAKDKLYHAILPVIAMTFCSCAGLTRYVRTAMIESLSMDYIRTARAKGVREKAVIYSHAFRNALIPFITVMTGWFIGIFGGSVVLEQTFIWPGMGQMEITAIRQLDYSVALALMMFYVILSLVGNLIIDLLYGVADPRVRLS